MRHTPWHTQTKPVKTKSHLKSKDDRTKINQSTNQPTNLKINQSKIQSINQWRQDCKRIGIRKNSQNENTMECIVLWCVVVWFGVMWCGLWDIMEWCIGNVERSAAEWVICKVPGSRTHQTDDDGGVSFLPIPPGDFSTGIRSQNILQRNANRLYGRRHCTGVLIDGRAARYTPYSDVPIPIATCSRSTQGIHGERAYMGWRIPQRLKADEIFRA